MAQFNDEWQTSDDLVFRYHHASFAKGEDIWFARQKTDRDSQRMDALIEEHGGDTASLPDRTRAMIIACARRWTLKLPKSFVQPALDADGEVQYDTEGRPVTEPHPLAGKVPPITWEHVTRLPDLLLRDIVLEIGARYAGPFRDDGGDRPVQGGSAGAPPPAES